jgi:hypothetical protein
MAESTVIFIPGIGNLHGLPFPASGESVLPARGNRRKPAVGGATRGGAVATAVARAALQRAARL